MGWQSIGIVGASACVIFILHQKIQNMANKDTIFGYHPVGSPTCLCKQEVGKLSQKAAQHSARMQGYVNNDGLWKGWGFWVGTWNFDSLTGRTGEVVEALSDRKVDMTCIQETRWKGSGCKFCGTKGRRYKLFWLGGEESGWFPIHSFRQFFARTYRFATNKTSQTTDR